MICEACGKELRGGPLDHLTDADKEACPAHPGPGYTPMHGGAWVKEDDEVRCDVCGEPLEGDTAEMYDPNARVLGDTYICHAECGLQKGWEIA